ncbi:MAG: hypothetical protein JXA24_03875 [Proteobacteria bacterium]|nr:hypothetical protein [Pseudomonadota bacterium]
MSLIKSANETVNSRSTEDALGLRGSDVDIDLDSETDPAASTDKRPLMDRAADAATDAFCKVKDSLLVMSLIGTVFPSSTLLTGVRDVPCECRAETVSRPEAKSAGDDDAGLLGRFIAGLKDDIGGLLSGAAAFIGGVVSGLDGKIDPAPVRSQTISGKDVSRVFDDVKPGEKVLLIDFAPENIPAERAADAIVADHHSPGQEGTTATEAVAQLAPEGRLEGVVKVVGNHWDTDRVMAEAIGRGIITVRGEAAQAVFAARAGDYLVGNDAAMRVNWIVMSMIHGDRGGKFEKVPVEEIVSRVPEIISQPEKYEIYYKGTADFMEASREAVREGRVEVRAEVGLIFTERYAHPLAGYEAIEREGARVMIKQSPHPRGGYSYDVGFVPRTNMQSRMDLTDTFSALKLMESRTSNPHFDAADNWGCDPRRAGGSPRGYGSALSMGQVHAAVLENICRIVGPTIVDAAIGKNPAKVELELREAGRAVKVRDSADRAAERAAERARGRAKPKGRL